jgi:hypothetical protein
MTSRETALLLEQEHERHSREVCELDRRCELVDSTARRFNRELEQMHAQVTAELQRNESAQLRELLGKTNMIAERASWEARQAVRHGKRKSLSSITCRAAFSRWRLYWNA